MVIRRRARLGLILVVGAAVCFAGCSVKDTREDILRLILECSVQADCVSGYSCRSFALDPDETTYCLQDCAVDADCSYGDVCGGEGFCVEPCDVESFACRGPDFTCLRSNMMVGATAGYCQPAPTCTTYTDCGNLFDWCIADSLSQVAPELTFAEGHNTCVESCVDGAECRDGYQCLKQELGALGIISTEGVPEVCVPKCGPDNRCPTGYRCLTDALAEFFPEDPPDDPELNYCVPGLPGVLLPCTEDAHCLSGLCVEDPESLALYQTSYRFCVEPCDGQGECASVRFECLASEHGGAAGEFCFNRELLLGCEETEDCTAPEECLDWGNLDFGKACSLRCDGFRDPDCGTGYTCLPTDAPGEFGCYVGYPGMPCESHDQCHQGYGEQTLCLGTTGQATDPDRICTKTCTHYSQCTFGPYLLNSGAPLCHSGICQPIGFDCDDPKMPYERNTTLACASLFGQINVATVPCDGLRTTNHTCPEQFTCAPLPQDGVGQVEYYCAVGFTGLMPCRLDSECVDLLGDGSPRCVSPTGDSLAVDGLCTKPCREDADCPNFELGLSICLPGDPHPGMGVFGYCFMNPALEVILDEEQGRQGTFCPETPSTYCADNHTCVDPSLASGSTVNFTVGRHYCARHCPGGDGDCPQVPTPHRCIDSPGVCVPAEEAEHARGFWQECLDHRQCAHGICFQPDTTTVGPGHCTKLCSNGSGACAGYGDPGTDYEVSSCMQGVCQPVVIANPGGEDGP